VLVTPAATPTPRPFELIHGCLEQLARRLLLSPDNLSVTLRRRPGSRAGVFLSVEGYRLRNARIPEHLKRPTRSDAERLDI
jgi:hypothetical protein